MQVFKCDRCGNINHKDERPYASIRLELTQDIYCEEKFDLCEQCYTTIKEVLEDGEIK